MMVKIIHLKIEDSITGLAGFPYGKAVFDEQVKNEVTAADYEQGIEIVFPDKIKRITSSFVQGFFSDLVTQLGYYGVQNSIKVSSSSAALSASVFEALE